MTCTIVEIFETYVIFFGTGTKFTVVATSAFILGTKFTHFGEIEERTIERVIFLEINGGQIRGIDEIVNGFFVGVNILVF